MKQKLAIQGGKPAVTVEKQSYPVLSDEDTRAAIDVLKGGRLMGNAGSPQITALAKEWAEYIGTEYCIVLNSGTAALHAAVAAAEIGPGDEVITTPFSFLTSATSILYQNGIPVFADIKPDTYNIDPARIEQKISEKTKAILPVDIGGLPCDIDAIKAIAGKHNLLVIEDACQAHGVTYKGRKVGTNSDMTTFSLQWSKNLTTGTDGGLLVTDNKDFCLKAEMLGRFGEIIKPGEKRSYNAYNLGWMYRSDELSASIARSRLKRLDEENALRQKNCEYLTKELSKIKGVIPPYVPEDRTHGYYLYIIRFAPEALGISMPPRTFREKAQNALNAEGVDIGQWAAQPIFSTNLFKLRQGYGKGCPWSCPYSRDVEYNEEDYPVLMDFMDDFAVVWSTQIPNGLDLMECYVEAFHKVFDHIEEALT